MKKVMVYMLSLCWAGILPVASQRVAVKTNLLYDATTTFNFGIEKMLNSRWSLDVSANYNPWTFSENKKWKHWMVQPELRFWHCERLNGHFLGVHLHGGQFNVGNLNTSFRFLGTDFRKLKDARYEGWFVGAGIAYGYSWILSRHWNLEAEIGIGYSYSNYDKFDFPKCGEWQDSGHHHYVGLTKAALNMVYVF